MIVQEGMETYKLSKDCHNQKIEFSAQAYLIKKNVVQSKVAGHFSNLDLTFLDEELEAEEDELAPEVEATVDPLHQLPELVMLFPFCIYKIDLLFEYIPLCRAFGLIFENINERIFSIQSV